MTDEMGEASLPAARTQIDASLVFDSDLSLIVRHPIRRSPGDSRQPCARVILRASNQVTMHLTLSFLSPREGREGRSPAAG